jgi:rhamnogalacturonyl hydrolase YesR
MARIIISVTLATLPFLIMAQDQPKEDKALTQAIQEGLDYLVKTQKGDGSWGKRFTIAVTSFSGLAMLAYDERPFNSRYSDALMGAYRFIIKKCKQGMFPQQGHTWIHGQGFATLFLAEFYGKVLLAKKDLKVDKEKLKETIKRCVKQIQRYQSSTGGWWYRPEQPGQHEHENSTTVCAVQALRSAANYGIQISKDVLKNGFEYLKKCQNKDGGFRYKLHTHKSMEPGSAGCLATLVLMKKLDHQVLLNGIDYLTDVKKRGLKDKRFPYYWYFYSAFAMKIIHEEYGKHQPQAGKWFDYVRDKLLKQQGKDGSWPLSGWIASHESPSKDYSTAFALVALQVPKGNLSIFHREAPELPKKEDKR